MSERGCTCGEYHHRPSVRIQRALDCPIHGTEKGTIPPLNVDNDAQNVQNRAPAEGNGHSESVLSGFGVLSQYAETEPESGNGVSDETARNVEDSPVVERLEKRIAETERLMEAYPNSRYTTGVAGLPFLKDALTAIHDLRVEAASQERWADEYKIERDILQTTYEGCCKEYEKLEVENARLREALERLSMWKAVGDSGYKLDTGDPQSKEIHARIKVARQALTGEQDGSRFTNDEQERK